MSKKYQIRWKQSKESWMAHKKLIKAIKSLVSQRKAIEDEKDSPSKVKT